MITDKQKWKYLKAVSRRIHCRKKDKADFLKTLEISVSEISLQDDVNGTDSIIGALGSPKTVAEEFERLLEPGLIKKYKRERLLIATAVLAAVLVPLICFYIHMLHLTLQPGSVLIPPAAEISSQ